jgi:hypothetical protein
VCVAADITKHSLTPCNTLRTDVRLCPNSVTCLGETTIHVCYEDQLASALNGHTRCLLGESYMNTLCGEIRSFFILQDVARKSPPGCRWLLFKAESVLYILSGLMTKAPHFTKTVYLYIHYDFYNKFFFF